jgi:nucleotide-binding universal stress UspA family protein
MSATSDTRPAKPVIICYDGSPEATEAVDYVAALFPGGSAVIVSVWKPVIEEVVAPSALAPPVADPVEARQSTRRAAIEAARDGVRRAESAGLSAESIVIETTGPMWKAIEDVASTHDALLIACGTRRSGMKSALPGNLANALVQHASRPVLIVPSGKAAAERRREAQKEKAGIVELSGPPAA